MRQHLAFSTVAISAAISLLTPIALAQVLPGDIGISAFSTASFGVARPPSVISYTTPGFQGTGITTSQAILHDPGNFHDFLVGGFGFVGRATITGAGTVTYALITSLVGIASQMSWDPLGNIVIADSGTDQVRVVTPFGSVLELSVGSQPWGAHVNAGAFERMTGDVIVGGNGALYRLVNGTTTGVTIVTNLGGFVSAVAFDTVNGDMLATVLSVNRIVRVTAGGIVTDLVTPGAIVSPNALDLDANGDLIVGGIAGVFRVPFGGPATLVATTSVLGSNVSGVSVAKITPGFAGPFGTACNGSSGPATLIATGPIAIGTPFTTTSTNHQPLALGLWAAGLSNTVHGAIPLPLLLDPLLGTTNCFLNVSPDLTLVAFTNALGAMSHSFTPPPPFAGQRIHVQHAVLEAVPGGLSFSNGILIQF